MVYVAANVDQTLLGKLLPVWKSVHDDLSGVIRWKKYLKDGLATENIRVQPTLHHTLSYTIVGTIGLLLIKKHIPTLDDALVGRAFPFHDLPEGFLKRDIILQSKTDQEDLKEYTAFLKEFRILPESIFHELKRSFLLQFAERIPACFPNEAKQIMEDLRRFNSHEVMTFGALERWEYTFYALETDKEGTHPHLLTWVLRNQLPYFEAYAKRLPGFRQEIFNTDFEQWIREYLEDHQHIPNQ